MEFRFNVNNLLQQRINKISHTLLPEGFRGDRREYNECQRLLTRILDEVGEASAKAQGLNRTITSALKIRDTDHIIYLMVDSQGNNGLGSILGLLKTGSKTLFMFDDEGYHYQLKPRCILDFYIHESQQRKGLGSELYEHMLREENLKPIKLAIDRPSDKFLAFLKKNYGLTKIIPQNNKFVVFKGFFDDETEDSPSNRYTNPNIQNQKMNEYRSTSSNGDAQSVRDGSISGSVSGSPKARSAYGRYAASRPPCSMASIIHDTAAMGPTEYPRSARSRRSESVTRPDSLNLQMEENTDKEIANEAIDDNSKNVEEIIARADSISSLETQPEATLEFVETSDAIDDNSAPLPDQYNENINNDDACTTAPSKCSQEDAAGRTSDGYLDLKFYHSPLW